MLKIEPYSTTFNKFKLPEKQVNTINHKQDTNRTKKILCYTAAAALAGGTILYTVIYNKKAMVNSVIKTLKKQTKAFPLDIDYRKNILKAIGFGETNYARLRSVIGPQEYKSIVVGFSNSPVHYTPGSSLVTNIKDGYELNGVFNKTFRASMHNHTTYSDGRMSIQELLDQSAEYADVVAEKIKNNTNIEAANAPFTIAITDHDTLDGCKEAVKIIAANPEKYKNLRVVLGVEITAENRMLKDKLKKPVHIHYVVNAINPFDTDLNKFIDAKKTERNNLMESLIKKSLYLITDRYPDFAVSFSIKEAESLYPVLKHKILHVNYSLKNYLQYKTIFESCFAKNKELQKMLANSGIQAEEIKFNSFLNKYIDKSEVIYAENGYDRYYKALKKYVADILNISEYEAAQKLEITPELKGLINELGNIAVEAQPKMDLQPWYVDAQEMIELINNQKYGYITWAHPACTDIGDYLKNKESSIQSMSDLFKIFKEKAKDKALAAEIYYPYFGNLGKSKDWLNSMRIFSKNNNLFFTGGIDSHGHSIFYSNK